MYYIFIHLGTCGNVYMVLYFFYYQYYHFVNDHYCFVATLTAQSGWEGVGVRCYKPILEILMKTKFR